MGAQRGVHERATVASATALMHATDLSVHDVVLDRSL
jgi:hypothetical protein